MNYPVWDLPFAHGLLIAIVAITHVFVSHFAVGGGLYLVVVEHLARRRKDEALLAVLQAHSRFFILLTLVFGAISGVGIWFTISLINPAGTSALIHTFVWAWAIEWTFFVTEVAAAMFYYYGWRTLSPGRHLAVGWIYFIAAWASMIVINGILAFQLTPGTWLQTRGFWDGFFNPTYVSSLAVRTFYAISIAGMFALWTAAGHRDLDGERRRWLIRSSGLWSLVGVALAALSGRWWWSTVPEEIRRLTSGDMPFASAMTHWTPIMALVLAGVVLAGPILYPRAVRRPLAVFVLLIGFSVMATGEWTREGIRKPWVISGYLYSNGVLASDVEDLQSTADLSETALWADPAERSDPVAWGEQVYRVQCAHCHARRGYLGLQSRVARWDEAMISAMAFRTGYIRRRMPPFVGSEEDAAALGAYLASLRPADYRVPEQATGAAVFEVRCGSCHTVDATNPIRELVEGLSAEDVLEFLPDMESEYMPAFTGTDQEARLLAEWLETVGAGETVEVSARPAGPSTPPTEEAGR